MWLWRIFLCLNTIELNFGFGRSELLDTEWISRDHLEKLRNGGNAFCGSSARAHYNYLYHDNGDTLRLAYQEIRTVLLNEPAVQDFRTAAFVVALRKIGTTHLEMGV